MSLEVISRLLCDGHQCDLIFRIRMGESATDARARAATQGWTCPRRGRDLCPDCSATP